MRLLALCLLLTLPAVAIADPPKVVPVPAPEPEKWVRLEGATPGKLFVMGAEPASKWRLETPGAELRVFDNGKSGVFLAQAAAVYRVTVTGPAGDVTQLELPVGESPLPPVPGNDLKARLKAAIDADPAPAAKKKGQVKDLAAVYREIAKAAADTTITTAGEFIATAKRAAAAMVDGDSKTRTLAGVRDDVVAKEVAAIFPADGSLTDAQRKAAADLFTRLAEALEGF